MQRVRLAVARASLQFVLPSRSHFSSGTPPHPRVWTSQLARLRLELLHPFITVKCFYVSQDLVPHIAPVMQDIGGKRVAEVLPALQTHFLEEQLPSLLPSRPVQESIGKFVAARQLASHPVTVSRLKRL